MTIDMLSVTTNNSYIYDMNILRKHSIQIKRSYLYVVALLFSAIVLLQIIPRNTNSDVESILGYVILFVSNYFVWAVFIEYINGGLHELKDSNKSIVVRVFELLLSFSLLLIFHLVITNVIYYSYLLLTSDLSIQMVWKDFSPFIVKSLLSRSLDLLIIVFLLKLVDGYSTLQKKKLEVVDLESQLRLSQLEALRAQLDPHFLFNTLHTLHSLIGYDDKKAKSMLIKVTALMRRTLEQQGKQMISLGEELEYIQNYLDIEQERFHDRLMISLEIDENSKPILVPSLILQPLVENAFKHGISLIEKKGELSLSTRHVDGKLVIHLTNSIPEKELTSKVPSNGVGLNNVQKRLKQVFGDDHLFSINSTNDMFEVTISIDFKENS